MPADSIPSSSGASMEGNSSENILGSSPGARSLRDRTESESSDGGMRFVFPSVDGSPPKVLTLNEVADVMKNINKMEIMHEIVLNPEFKLQPYEPPENSLERRIKDTLHKAFWDHLREQLKQTPPCYDHAIKLLSEIKECFPQILSQNNQRALERINEVLDEAVIRQQAEQGVLDFRAYANFIIQIMAKSCAPARDDAVKKLTEIDDVVETFRGILDVMALMKLDMANFLIDFARKDIMVHSVEYEKSKFKEFLEYYKFGFPATENWLKRNCTQNANNVPSTVDQTIWNAYLELMDWDDANEFPEVLSIDKQRILKLGQRAKRLSVCASLNAILSGIPIISQRNENRLLLAKEIEILLKGVTNEKEIKEALPNIWEQIKCKINDFLTKEGQAAMDATTEGTLKAQILQIANKDAPVRTLMWKRLQTFFRLMSRSKTGPPPPPPGFLEYQEELEAYATALKYVIAYNHSIFSEYLAQILTGQQKPEEEVPANSASMVVTENQKPDANE